MPLRLLKKGLHLYHCFWTSYPALWYGLLLLFTVLFYFTSSLWIVFPLAGLIAPFIWPICIHKLLLASLFVACSSLWLSLVYPKPPANFEGLEGVALVTILSMQTTSSPYGNYLKTEATLDYFVSENRSNHLVKHYKTKITVPKSQSDSLQTGNRYWIRGRLTCRQGGCRLKMDPETPPFLVKRATIPLAEWRERAKDWVKEHLNSQVKDPRSANFMVALATGSFDDRMTQHQLGRFGLLHLLAISGFHFALLASFAAFLLALCLRHPMRDWLLLGLLLFYTFYLGDSPSVMRAWIMLSLALVAPLVGRQSQALNTLGVALLALILLDPYSVLNVGFQFSCAITAAILLFNAPFDQLLKRLFPSRFLSEAIKMSRLEQHAIILLAHFRKLLALTFAINLIALPLTLAYFYKFPLNSLAYNLFFPLLTAPVLALLFIGLFFDCFSFTLGGLIHSFNGFYTHRLLNLAYNMPETVDYVWRTNALTPLWLGGILTILFALGIFWYSYQRHEETSISSPLLYLG